MARPPSSSSSSDDACVNLGESLELQAPTQTETPAKLVGSRWLAVSGAVEAPGTVFEVTQAAVGPSAR